MTTTTTAAGAAGRVVHVEHCMGTAFSIDIRDPGQWHDAIDEAVAWLHHVDDVFSTYKPGSDISRIRRRELCVDDADPLVREVLDRCDLARQETDGYFTPRLSGRLDPTGLVKGWAVQRASTILRTRGSRNHCVNGGGDIQLAGHPWPDARWVIGVSDPHDRLRVVATVAATDLAIATSGSAERGSHIVNPFTETPPRGLASVTVVGPELARADAYATAAFAMGVEGLRWLEQVEGYDALLVTTDAEGRRTSGWPGSA